MLQQFFRALVAPPGKNNPALVQQSAVVRRWAADLLAERDDLAVEVIELAARTTLETLQSRRSVRAVGRKIAGKPFAENDVAQ